jgi:hypothetical protein
MSSKETVASFVWNGFLAIHSSYRSGGESHRVKQEVYIKVRKCTFQLFSSENFGFSGHEQG